MSHEKTRGPGLRWFELSSDGKISICLKFEHVNQVFG